MCTVRKCRTPFSVLLLTVADCCLGAKSRALLDNMVYLLFLWGFSQLLFLEKTKSLCIIVILGRGEWMVPTNRSRQRLLQAAKVSGFRRAFSGSHPQILFIFTVCSFRTSYEICVPMPIVRHTHETDWMIPEIQIHKKQICKWSSTLGYLWIPKSAAAEPEAEAVIIQPSCNDRRQLIWTMGPGHIITQTHSTISPDRRMSSNGVS